MKVLVVNNMAPFVWGGAEELAMHLTKQLNLQKGVEAELLRVPFAWHPAEVLVEQMLLCQNLELWDVDRVIALKFPAYLIPHHNKIFWLLHQYRQAYDLWNSEFCNIPHTDSGERIRSAIEKADAQVFSSAKKIYTNSQTTADRLKKFNGFSAEVLLPPLNDPELFTGQQSQGYFFAGGRINLSKRQHLLIEALALCDTNIKLVIAGPPDTPDDAERLHLLVEKHRLQDRVKIIAEFLSRKDLACWVNEAAACCYLPVDEDSVGYVTMEAFCAAKPVITMHDAGGVLSIVEHGNTGWVAQDVAGLANALTHAQSEPSKTKKMGLQAHRKLNQMGLNWLKVTEKLLS